MATYLYRCNHRVKGEKCGARRALKRKVKDYVRHPKCLSCGTLLTYIDRWQRKKNRESVCNCDGLHYPHRAGSTVWCVQHQTGPTDEDYEDRYGR